MLNVRSPGGSVSSGSPLGARAEEAAASAIPFFSRTRLSFALAAAALVCFAQWSGPPLRAESPPAAEAVLWCTNPEYPPYDWLDEGGKYAGAGVELLSMLAPEGCTLIPAVVPWPRAQAMAAEGKIDILMCIRETPERSSYLKFSAEPVFANPIVVWVRKGEMAGYSGRSDLRGSLGGVSRGDFFGGGFDEYLRSSLRYEEASSMKENFKKLRDGRIAWFVTGRYSGTAWLKAHGLGEAIVALKPPISDEGIFLGFSKKSRRISLLPLMNARLAELRDRGVPEKLLAKYLDSYRAPASVPTSTDAEDR